jgi:hypothetical protein
VTTDPSSTDGPQELPDGLVPAPLFNAVKVAALRCALAAMGEGNVGSEIESIIDAGPLATASVLGYLIENFTEALERGYGGRVAAICEIKRELARAMINPDEI